ncbi:sentrin-specific protease 1 [Vigna unguiculata]|uniref:Sentrin-specific protease 1 n=1 Tax=Vigna unguiculata TaxID=3917 RepID=A0A4D6MWF7_VIGUN|nr:sentrin-specific protease 1 [Vigna unguiculata]
MNLQLVYKKWGGVWFWCGQLGSHLFVVVRNRCKTDYIVKVNGLLRSSHRSRIGRTPFRWTSRTVTNMPFRLLDNLDNLNQYNWSSRRFWLPMAEEEEGVSRKRTIVVPKFAKPLWWVTSSLVLGCKVVVRNRCKTDYIVKVNGLLRSSHRSRIGRTPFRWCVDMVKPLDINGVLLKHTLSRTSRTVTNMPFRLLDNLDNLYQYNWSRSVHSFLVEGFNRAYHTLRQDQNTSGITVAGSVAIFQLLVCRLLNVGSYEGDVSFPRILSWPSLVIRTHGIKSAFESNRVVLEWELIEDEKNIDVVREALNVGAHGIPKKGVDDMSFTKFKQWCKRKLKRNYRVVQQLKDQLNNMEEEYGCGGQEPDPSSFEQPEPYPFHEGDHFDVEEPQCRPFDHPSSSHQPQPSSFDQGDGCDVEEAHAHHCNKPDQGTPEYNPHGMEIIPYVEPGKCSLDVDLSELYRILVSQDGRQTVVDINQQILTTVECCGFRPRGKLSNMAILFACNNFMYRQRKLNGVIKRVVFGTLYTTVVVEDSRKVKAKRREWVLGDYNNFLRRGLVSVHDILSADFVFAPIIHEQHWWCYAINCRTRQFFVLDSLGSKRQGRKRIDNAIARNMGILFDLLENRYDADKLKFEVLTQDLPLQPNLYDCGMLVLRYIELWDGETKFGDKYFLAYTSDELQELREQYICDWFMDDDNIHRNYWLQVFDVYKSK